MSAILATESGLLTWVKPEIDFALERACSSFAMYFADPARNGEAMSVALGSVREVTGALQIIGMEGLATIAKEIDAVLKALASEDLAPEPRVEEVLRRASESLGRYLRDLMAGVPTNMTSLRTLLEELVRLRGGQVVDDLVLFHPDSHVSPPPLALGNQLEGEELGSFVRLQRGQYQRGMLSWLRQSDDGLERMRHALQEVERVQPSPRKRAPWWLASAFVEGLLSGGLATSDAIKRTASKIDRYLASFARGGGDSTELMRELLLHLANCQPVTQLIRDVKLLYRLDYLYVAPELTGSEFDSTSFGVILRRAQNLLEVDRDAWTGHASQQSKGVGDFLECLARLRRLATTIPELPLTALIEAMQLVVGEMSVLDAERRAAVVLETDAALVSMERRLREPNLPQSAAEFVAIRERLLACLAEHQAAVARVPSKKEDRELLKVVGSEMSVTLKQVERSLDAFFRNQVSTPPLAQLPGLMRNVAGALSVVGAESAAQLVDRCMSIVAALQEPNRVLSSDETVLLADGLSSVMLYVQTFGHGNREELCTVEAILARFDAREALLASSSVPDLQMTPEGTESEQPNDLDFDLMAGMSEAKATSVEEGLELGADFNGEEVTAGELAEILDRFDLGALRDELGTDAIASESILATEALASPRSVSIDFEQDGVEVDARGDGIDPEIVSIFIEEANGILAAMEDLVTRARAEPDDVDNLATLGRSYHTLKGSGRMAGLCAIGDAAWTVESLLNHWLEAERPASGELIKLAALGRELFGVWIDDIAQRGCTTVRTAALSAQAKRVANELAAYAVKSTCAVDATSDVPIASLDLTMGAPLAEPVPEVITGSTVPAPLFRIFVEEARQNVEVLRVGLAAVRSSGDREARDNSIRAAHTLGGIARTVGFPDITVVAGVIENALRDAVDRPRAYELLQSAQVTLEALVENVRAGRVPELSQDRRAEFSSQLNALESDGAVSPAASIQLPAQVSAAEFREDGLTRRSVGVPQAGVESEESLGRVVSEALLDSGHTSPEDPQQYPAACGNMASMARLPSDRRLLKDDVDKQLLPIFLDEVRDLTPLISQDLRHLRDEPNDAAAFDSLRRVLHTIKGASRMIGAIRLGELVHIMEGRVAEAVEHGVLNPESLDLLETEFDRLTCGFDALERGELQEDVRVGAPGRKADSVLGAKGAPDGYNDSERMGSSFSAFVRVSADTLDRLLNQAGEISISRGRIEAEIQTFKQFLLELTDSVTRLRGQLGEIEIHAESRLQATHAQPTGHKPDFDPLEFDRFTRFQELTRLMAESLHDVATVQQHLFEGLTEVETALSAEFRFNRGLQDDLMRLRTVTFQNVGERLYRVARQAARETGKKAEFEVVGGQTEVDRGVLERIAAPLEHLVRNAVTHGIEAADHRIRAGKPETGTIRLLVQQESNDLLVSLSDDGRGIDHQGIRAKAFELGWLRADAEPSSWELEQMILRPGFSTATELNELAGRGVGMDAVMNEVRALGGRLEIETENGHGTTFAIRVPLTLVMAKVVIATAGGRRWAILSNLVEHVQDVSADKLSEVCANETIEWLGQRYPAYYLPQLLGESMPPAGAHSRHFALLIRSGDRRVAVLVDQVVVNQDVVLKKLGPQLAGLPGVNGATVASNGELVFVVDPALLAGRVRGSELRSFETGAKPDEAGPLVMVVDDSLTVRKVTSRLLLRNGFRVATARDGLEALHQIQATTPDVLLVDIEMPRMDGFELAKNLKANQRTAKLPIIMITSRLAPKHREYAEQLGVDVYLGKPFAERELLEHIGVFTTPAAAA